MTTLRATLTCARTTKPLRSISRRICTWRSHLASQKFWGPPTIGMPARYDCATAMRKPSLILIAHVLSCKKPVTTNACSGVILSDSGACSGWDGTRKQLTCSRRCGLPYESWARRGKCMPLFLTCTWTPWRVVTSAHKRRSVDRPWPGLATMMMRHLLTDSSSNLAWSILTIPTGIAQRKFLTPLRLPMAKNLVSALLTPMHFYKVPSLSWHCIVAMRRLRPWHWPELRLKTLCLPTSLLAFTAREE